jgi:N-acetyl-gamma-glutamyl-phosphate reductase
MKRKRVAILGASGYTAGELAAILLRHSGTEIVAATSRKDESLTLADHHPRLRSRIVLQCEPFNPEELAKKQLDFVFSCLPHGASAEAVSQVLRLGIRVVDLSADYRIRSAQEQRKWYGQDHHDPENMKHAVYGLPEMNELEIASARLVANPGCYPQTVILSMAPLVKNGWIDNESIVADCKSGISGAGRTPKLATHFPECNESVTAYQVGIHRHTPEMEQALDNFERGKTKVLFIPHLIPMDRGIFATVVATPHKDLRESDLLELFEAFYSRHPFVRIVRSIPTTKNTLNTNFIDIHPTIARGKLVVLACLDNLIRGASGVAVQNFNIMNGWCQKTGLDF